MSSASDFQRSCLKTATLAAIVAATAALLAIAGIRYLHGPWAMTIFLPCVLLAGVSSWFVASAAVVWHRESRSKSRQPDWYLALNGGHSAESIHAGAVRVGPFRRGLARLLNGHGFVVGDAVRVRSLAEVRATLDADGGLDGLPFMAEMVRYCGRETRVFRCLDKVLDYRRTRRLRNLRGCVLLVDMRCDGGQHGGCEAACHTIWKVDWLERIKGGAISTDLEMGNPTFSADSAARQSATGGEQTYSCQFTCLHQATGVMKWWHFGKALKPLASGNISFASFLVGLLTRTFNALQGFRGGIGYPPRPLPGAKRDEPAGTRPLSAGDAVVVKSTAEITGTLDLNSRNRGLWFDVDMFKHCGHEHVVRGRIERILDAATGSMLSMKTSCIVLDGVEYSGEYLWFGSQHELLFWREAWLERAGS